MVAALQIVSHRYKKIDTTVMEFKTNSFKPDESESRRVESVKATFNIIGGESFRKTSRSGLILAKTLHITFCSVNGDGWDYDRFDAGEGRETHALGLNVKKDGTLGAEVKVFYFDFPGWLKNLYQVDFDSRSDALDWVRAEYAR